MTRSRRRVAASVTAGLIAGLLVPILTATAAQADPVAEDQQELVFIHGYGPKAEAQNCGLRMGFDTTTSWTGLAGNRAAWSKYVGYHYPAYYSSANGEAADTNCYSHTGGVARTAIMTSGTTLTTTRETPIGLPASTRSGQETLALRFAEWFRTEFVTRRQGPNGAHPAQYPRVDLVGHSMGGLIVRAALDHHPAHFIDPVTWESMVDDVVTAGSPHGGLPYDCPRGTTYLFIIYCTMQVSQMSSGTTEGVAFFGSLGRDVNGNGTIAGDELRTTTTLGDFTAVGSGFYDHGTAAGTACSPNPFANLDPDSAQTWDGAGTLWSAVHTIENHQFRLCDVTHLEYMATHTGTTPRAANDAESWSQYAMALILDDSTSTY